jgi:hypothetical protein
MNVDEEECGRNPKSQSSNPKQKAAWLCLSFGF